MALRKIGEAVPMSSAFWLRSLAEALDLAELADGAWQTKKRWLLAPTLTLEPDVNVNHCLRPWIIHNQSSLSHVNHRVLSMAMKEHKLLDSSLSVLSKKVFPWWLRWRGSKCLGQVVPGFAHATHVADSACYCAGWHWKLCAIDAIYSSCQLSRHYSVPQNGAASNIGAWIISNSSWY